LYYLVVMLCSVFDFGDCCFDICLLCCLHLFLFVCSVFPDKFHVQLSCDRFMDLRNDICMYVQEVCIPLVNQGFENALQFVCFLMKQQWNILRYMFKNLLKEVLASSSIKISSQFSWLSSNWNSSILCLLIVLYFYFGPIKSSTCR